MPDIKWSVDVANAYQEGRTPWKPGPIQIRPDMPCGTMQSVTAHVPLAMRDSERLFMNGYQTWTYCPEYSKTDKMRSLDRLPRFLIDRYSLDRYGDYDFVHYPGKRGLFHGFSYCYFRDADRYRLIGSLDERPGYTIFRYDSHKEELSVERDMKGVQHPGGELHAFDLFYAEGSEDEVFDAWFSAMGVTPRTRKRLAGYSSWYNRYEDISASSILEDLKGCKALFSEGDLFQLDDGWEPHVGDWLEADPSKFPDGLKTIVDQVHDAGLIAGLWLAPFGSAHDAGLSRNHPEMLLKKDGMPWKAGSNWGGFYGLDIDSEQTHAYLEQVFDRVLNDWGFDLVKLDFLYSAAPFGTETESRAGRMIRAMKLLRKWCKDKLILGCGVPVMPAFGLVDYCRISCDVSLDWDDKPHMRLLHRERVSTKQAMGNTIYRRQLNGRAYMSDPDVFFLRDDNVKLRPEQKQRLAKVDALLGSMLLTSDNPATYTPQAIRQYEHIVHMRGATNIRVHTDDGVTISYVLDAKEHSFRAL